MCPSYLATRDEKDSTRGRARVLQEMVNGTLVAGGWRAPEVREALDLCLACKGCSSDCPTGVDMATYKAEVLHQAYRRRLRPITHYSLGWLPRWARLASQGAEARQRHARRPVRQAGQAAGRHRRAPQRAPVRRLDLPRVVRPASERGRRPGDAVGRHVHRPLLARGRHRGRAGARARRLLGAHPGEGRLLRPDLDQHRPARRRPEDPAPQRVRARAGRGGGHPDRRPGTVVHRRLPGRRRAPVHRREPTATGPPRSPPPRARSPNC